MQQWTQYFVRDSTVKPSKGAYGEASGIFLVIDKHNKIVYDERNHTFYGSYKAQLTSYNIITNKVQYLTDSHKISYMVLM